MKAEQKLYQWIIAAWPGHAQRIEDSLCPGIPDLNLCYKGAEIWVECKILTRGSVLLRPQQYAWGMRRAAAGGTVLVVAQGGGAHYHALYLWKFPLSVETQGKYLRITTSSQVIAMNPTSFRNCLLESHLQYTDDHR